MIRPFIENIFGPSRHPLPASSVVTSHETPWPDLKTLNDFQSTTEKSHYFLLYSNPLNQLTPIVKSICDEFAMKDDFVGMWNFIDITCFTTNSPEIKSHLNSNGAVSMLYLFHKAELLETLEVRDSSHPENHIETLKTRIHSSQKHHEVQWISKPVDTVQFKASSNIDKIAEKLDTFIKEESIKSNIAQKLRNSLKDMLDRSVMNELGI